MKFYDQSEDHARLANGMCLGPLMCIIFLSHLSSVVALTQREYQLYYKLDDDGVVLGVLHEAVRSILSCGHIVIPSTTFFWAWGRGSFESQRCSTSLLFWSFCWFNFWLCFICIHISWLLIAYTVVCLKFLLGVCISYSVVAPLLRSEILAPLCTGAQSATRSLFANA